MPNMNAEFPERIHRPQSPAPWERKEADEGGPKRPDAEGPDTKELLKKK